MLKEVVNIRRVSLWKKNNLNESILIVLDSVGIGESPDADLFGDVGADTLGHIAEAMNGLKYAEYGETRSIEYSSN